MDTDRRRDWLLSLCRADPNAFIEFVAGYKQAEMHVELQGAISDYSSTYFEFPRNHGKTDQIIYRCAWEIGHNPDILIKVVKANDPEAIDFTMAVRDIIESRRYKMIFPEIIPDARAWGKQSLRVIRKDLISKDPTIRGSGIFGNPGGRADWLIFDDICTLKNSVQNAAQREQVKLAYRETWLPFLKQYEDTTLTSKITRICTPWHVDDVTADWRKSKEAVIKVFRRPCRGTEVSPWPEMWSSDRLVWMKELMGPIAFARAYELKPLTGEELVFPPEELEASLWTESVIPKVGKIVATIDLAFREANQPWKSRKADPDWSVILIARLTPDGHVYPFHMVRERMAFPVFRARLVEMIHKHNVEYVVSEDVGALIGLNQQLEEDIPCGLKRVTRVKDKHTRAIETQKIVFQHRFHIPKGKDEEILPMFVPLFEEMTAFPFSDHDDTVDCAVDMMNEVHIVGHREDEEGMNVYSYAHLRKHGVTADEFRQEANPIDYYGF